MSKGASATPNGLEELVRAHVDAVYAAALRQVKDPHLAADVTQAVFLILQKKYGQLAPDTIISAWLMRTTRYAALTALQRQRRRINHERKAAKMRTTVSEIQEEPWSAELDRALDRLGGAEREAIVLAYFEGLTHQELAQRQGISKDAADKRIQRALDKLRRILAKPGTQTSMVALTGALLGMAAPAPAPAAVMHGTLAAVGGEAPVVAQMIAKVTIGMMGLLKAQVAAAYIVLATGMTAAGVVTYQRTVWAQERPVATLAEQQRPVEAATKEAAPSAAEFSKVAYNTWSQEKRLNFIIARLQERDQSLQNFSYTCEELNENIDPASKVAMLSHRKVYFQKRLGEKLWLEQLDDPDIMHSDSTKYYWDGQQTVSLHPYPGPRGNREYWSGQIYPWEGSTFYRSLLNPIIGVRSTQMGGGPFVTNNGNFASWIEQFRAIALGEGRTDAVVADAIAPSSSSLILTIQEFPNSWTRYSLDPARGFMVCNIVSSYVPRDSGGDVSTATVAQRIEVVEAERVQNVWVPKRVLRKIGFPTSDGYIQQGTFEIKKFEIGTVKVADLQLDFPIETHVSDAIQRIAYIIKADGSYELLRFPDGRNRVMRNPVQKVVQKIDAQTTQLYTDTPSSSFLGGPFPTINRDK